MFLRLRKDLASSRLERQLMGFASAFGVALAVLYLCGALSGRGVAISVSIGVSVAAGAYITRNPPKVSRSRAQRTLAIVAGLAASAAGLVASLTRLLPPPPIVTKDISSAADVIVLPPGTRGDVSIVVTTTFPTGDDALVRVRVMGAERPIDARLEQVKIRGEGGHRHLVRDSQRELARIPGNVRELAVERLDGLVDVPVRIAILPTDWVAPWAVWSTASLALLVVAVIGTRARLSDEAEAAAGLALGFGMFVHGTATPDSALRSVLGALLLGTVLGGLAGWLVGHGVRRLLPSTRGLGAKGLRGR